MRCKNCDYNLWALKARECPECGRPFLPSEYEFVPGSVRFGCPHCDQSYYGTAPNGHLVPSEFDCVQCGRRIRMDEMVLFPAEGVQEQQTRPEGQPWLERAERGRVFSWFRTIGMAMVAPQRFMRLTPVESSVGDAWWFAFVTQFLFSFTGILPIIVFPLIMLATMRGAGAPGGAAMGGVFGVMFLISWLGMLVAIAIWGLLAHAVLLMTGGTNHSIGRTYQAFCYSSGANALMAIPCVGFYMVLAPSWIWWMVSAILMLREGQRVHGGRATLAVLIPPVLAIALLICLAATIRSGVAFPTTMSVTSSPAILSQSVGAQSMTDALLDYTRQHNGRPPAHAIELVHTNYLPDADVFLISDPGIRNSQIPVGDTTLARIQSLPLDQRSRAVKTAVAALPPRPVAHRLGDYVFTYHGYDPNSADPNLWLFIVWPDIATGGGLPEQMVTVGTRQGVRQFPTSDLPNELQEQNKLRARHNLPPLPHPSDVDHPPSPAASPQSEP